MKILITEKQLRLLIKEDRNIFVPRRMEDREERYRDIVLRKIQDYIKNGSKGNLDLSYTPITSLPDNLTVGGGLFLTNTLIKSLPDNLTVGGDLDLSRTPIQSLPDNLTVGGGLRLTNTPITSLPDNLTVKGGLNLSYTPITSLPNNLTVGKSLFLHNTPLSKKYSKDEIRKMIEDKGGSVSRDIYM